MNFFIGKKRLTLSFFKQPLTFVQNEGKPLDVFPIFGYEFSKYIKAHITPSIDILVTFIDISSDDMIDTLLRHTPTQCIIQCYSQHLKLASRQMLYDVIIFEYARLSVCELIYLPSSIAARSSEVKITKFTETIHNKTPHQFVYK